MLRLRLALLFQLGTRNAEFVIERAMSDSRAQFALSGVFILPALYAHGLRTNNTARLAKLRVLYHSRVV